MKEVLIVFIVLLILLLLLSTLGGSIRVNENYEDDIPLYEGSLLPSQAKPWESNLQYVRQEYPCVRQESPRVRQEESVRRINDSSKSIAQQTPMNEDNDAVYPYDGDETFAAV